MDKIPITTTTEEGRGSIGSVKFKGIVSHGKISGQISNGKGLKNFTLTPNLQNFVGRMTDQHGVVKKLSFQMNMSEESGIFGFGCGQSNQSFIIRGDYDSKHASVKFVQKFFGDETVGLFAGTVKKSGEEDSFVILEGVFIDEKDSERQFDFALKGSLSDGGPEKFHIGQVQKGLLELVP